MKKTIKQELLAIKEMVKENAADMGISPKKLFKQIANEGQQQPVQGEGFTPGKWKVVPISDCCLTIQIDGFREDKKGGYIAEIKWERNAGGIGKEDEANARLIAEAKNMYYNLKELREYFYAKYEGREGNDYFDINKLEAILNRIKTEPK